jgi:hypothetical protein
VALYGGAEVLAYPSHFEGFGLPALEAMACGTPVVASDISALREVSAGAATLVPPGDEEALANSIAALVEDRQLHAEARQRGIARAAAFGWTKTASALWEHARSRTRRRPPSISYLPSARAAGAPAGHAPAGGDAKDWAILATVVYGDLFDAAVGVDDLARTCLGVQIDAAEVRRRARQAPLSELMILDATESVVTLRGREHLVARREEGVRRTAELMQRHARVISALATLPFIRMLALSGGTAHKNARGGDDIDLFVVAAGGRAYTAYTMLFMVSRLTKTRGVVCPNYLVDEDHLEIAYHHDLFTAHQAISMVPIAGMEVFARFVNANDEWIRKLYPGYSPRPPAATLGRPGLQGVFERGVELAGDRLEQLLRVVWRLHLGRRVARATGSDLVLGGGILKLHLSDHRRRVLDRFEQRLQALRDEWERRSVAPGPARRSAPG